MVGRVLFYLSVVGWEVEGLGCIVHVLGGYVLFSEI